MPLREYSERGYWEERYRVGVAPFDWYMDYPALKPALAQLVPTLSASSRVLLVGCGTSPLGEQLFDDGFERLTLVDFADGCAALTFAKRTSWVVGGDMVQLSVVRCRPRANPSQPSAPGTQPKP
jgi:hypothetical protein